ncbi:MAG: DNA-binding protein YbiB [Rhizobacter sp.]|nr:DNA-binding protein YbiB [Rhizobacter sp.]
MSIAKYIREIGRGKDGARSLDRDQAHDLMSQVLDGQVTDLEIGAFAIAMRIKGESQDELVGFLDATTQRCIPLSISRPTLVLPSYNGARKLPNLTPLLALLMAQAGVQVLVHGPALDPARVTTAQVLHDLGLPAARNAQDVQTAWARHEPAFMQTDVLCPPLARLLEVRRTIGLRNSGHTVAKLLDPFRSALSLRVMNYTHPEYGTLLAEFVHRIGANSMLMRGTEGEPVADARRLPKLDVFVAGLPRADLSRSPQGGVLTELPVLPREHDASTTALYIQSVLSGEKPAPVPLLQQVETLMKTLIEMGQPAVAEQTA